jgi:hypothetical protein
MIGSVYRKAIVILAAAGYLPVLGATESLEAAVRRCAKESDQAQRLACFDAIVSTLPRLEADRFGMTAEIERKRDPGALEQAKSQVLSGKISDLQQAPHGEWIFTLDNQQVWLQAEPKASIEFAIGEAVHIEHGAMGSLWLVAEKNRKVRVKRLR